MQTLSDHITQSQVLARLHAIIKNRTQASLAEDIGISRSFLNEVIKGTRPPTGKILDYLGLRAETVYIKKGENQ
jgi:transcriptional regulator with XRE-family HTH domain